MPMFTVIGLYHSDGQVYADFVKANGAYEAMCLAARSSAAPDDLQLLCAIEGEHRVSAACEEGGAAFACDLIVVDDDE